MIRFNRLTALFSLTTALLLTAQPAAQAVDRVSNKLNGDWNTPADWTPAPGVAPSSADTLGIGTTAGGGAGTSTMTISGGNAQSNRIYIGGGSAVAGSAGTGTLNVNGGSNLWDSEYLYLGGNGTGGTNNGTLNVNGSRMNVLNGIYAARFSTSGVATISLNAGVLNNQGAADNTYLASKDDVSGQRATVTLTNGSVLNIGNTGGGTAASVLMGGNNTDSYATISISNNSRMNVGLSGSLFFRGGNPADATVINGTTGFARYTLPLSNSVGNGYLSQSRSITLGDQVNKVELTLNSTLAAGLASAATLNQFGTLTVASASNSSAQLNLVSMNMGFYGGALGIAGPDNDSNPVRGTLNLTNSTLRNANGALNIGRALGTTTGTLNLNNSQLIVRDGLSVGRSNASQGTMALTIDGTSRLVLLNGGISLFGGNNGVNQTYTLPLANTPTNGKISQDLGISVATGSNNKVTLNINSATSASSLNQWGVLTVGAASNDVGVVNVSDVNMTFRGGGMSIAGPDNDNNLVLGTLNLTNSTFRNTNGALNIGRALGTTTGTLTLNNSQLIVRDGLSVGRGNNSQGTMALTIGGTSQLVLENGGISLFGGNNGANQTYTLGLYNTPTNGKISQDLGISVATGTNNKVTLNIDSATSASSLNQWGTLTVGANSNDVGIVNVSGVNMTFRGGGLNIAGPDNNSNPVQGTLSLTNSTFRNTNGGLSIGRALGTTTGTLTLNNSQLIVRDGLSVGRGDNSQGTMALTIGGTSQLVLENGGISLFGGNNGANQTYTLGLYNTPTNGKISQDLGISVATGSNNKVTLNVDSATSASSLNQWGTLTIGNASNDVGIVNVSGVNMTFRGGGLSIAAPDNDSNPVLGTLSLTNSTMRITNGGLGIGRALGTTTGTLTLNNSQLIVRDGLSVGRGNNSAGTMALSFVGTSQLVLENGGISLFGGNNGVNQTYTLPLANTPTNGKISQDLGITVATGTNNKVTLNVDSATSASSLNQWGALTVGANSNDVGIMNVNGVNMTFRGGGLSIAGPDNNSNPVLGTLSLTNSTFRNTNGGLGIGRALGTTTGTLTLNNSQLIVRDGLSVGRGDNSAGTMALSFVGTSQLVLENGGISLFGGNNGVNQTYTLPLANTPTNGKISQDLGITVATGTNNKVTLNVNSATSASSLNQWGALTVGNATNDVGIMNVNGVNMTFRGGGMSIAGPNNDSNPVLGTLSLTNSTFRNTNGGLSIGRAIGNTIGTLSLDNSVLTFRDGLSVGRDNQNRGFMSLTMVGNSQLNFINGGIDIRGANNGAMATYNMALTDGFNPGNGKVSLNGGISLAITSANLVTLNVASGSSSRVMLSGGLNLGQGGGNSQGNLNIDTTRLEFSSSGNTANTSSTLGNITLANGAGFDVLGGLNLRSGVSTSGTSTITMNSGSTSLINGGTTFTMSGRVVNNSSTGGGGVLNVDFGNMNSGVSGTGNVTQGDFSLAGWVVNPGTGGKIVLKNLRNVTSTTDTIWGQNSTQSGGVTSGGAGQTPNVVNAVKVTFGGGSVTTAGDLAIGVIDPTSFNTGAEKVVGAFRMQPDTSNGVVLAAGPTVSIRYDSTRATAIAVSSESNLKLYQLVGGSWTLIPSTVDTGNKRITSNVAVNAALGNFVIIDDAAGTSPPGSTTAVAITPFVGNRVGGTTVRFNGSVNNNWDGSFNNWTESGTTIVRRAVGPEIRDSVEIGSAALNVSSVTLNNGLANTVSSLTLATSSSTLNNGTLTIDGANTSLRVTGNNSFNAAASTSSTTASLTLTNGASLRSDSAFNLATQDNTTGNLSLTDSRMMVVGDMAFATPANNGQNATTNVTLTNSKLETNGSLTIGRNSDARGFMNLTMDSSSQFNILQSLTLRGGNAGGNMTYNLPLASTPGNGRLSVGQSLTIADTSFNNVTVNADSTGVNSAGYISDSTINLDGSLGVGNAHGTTSALNLYGITMGVRTTLNVANGNGGTNGTLSLTNSNMTVLGEVGFAQPANDGNNATATLNLTNSILNTRGSVTVGRNGDARGVWVPNIDSNSQLNILSSLTLRGGNNGAGNITYNLPLTNTPTNGKVSMRQSLTIADTNFNNVTLNLDSTGVNSAGKISDSTFNLDGSLGIGNAHGTTSALNIYNMTMGVRTTLNVANGNGSTNGTLSLTNSNMTVFGEVGFAQPANDGNNATATLNLTNSILNTRGSVTVGRNGDARGVWVPNIDSNSQLNILSSLTLRGGNNGAGNITYNLPLTNTPTNGKVSMRQSLTVADTNFNNVTLNLDSTGVNSAGKISDSTFNLDGSLGIGNAHGTTSALNIYNMTMGVRTTLNVANGNGGTNGTLSLTNSNMTVFGEVGFAQVPSAGNNATATLNLTNSILNTRGSLTVGMNGDARGVWVPNIDSNSQLNILSSLTLRGGNNGAGNITYNLPLTNTPTNGKVSMRQSLTLSDTLDNNVTLNLDSTGVNSAGKISDSTINLDGSLSVANGNRSTSALNIYNMTMGVRSTFNMANNDNNANGTLSLTNSNMTVFGDMGFAQPASNGQNATATLNLTNSILNTRGSLTVGRDSDARGVWVLNQDANSQLNILSSLTLRGGNAGGNVTYNLPLTNTPTNGKVSMRQSLTLANTLDNKVTLNLDSTGVNSGGKVSDSTLNLDGSLSIAEGNRSTATLNLYNMTMGVRSTLNMANNDNAASGTLSLTNSNVTAFGSMGFAQPANNGQNALATVNLTNSTLSTRGSLTIGRNGDTRGRMALTMDGNSQFNILGDLTLRGGNAGGTASYTLPLASVPSTGKFSVNGAITLADTSNNRVDVTVDSTLAPGLAAGTDMSFAGALSMATSGSTIATATLKNTTMRFNGAGTLATGGTSQARITMTNTNLEFYNGMTLRNNTNDSAEITGTGSLTVAGTLTNSGRIVANGGDLALRAGAVARNTGISITQATGSYGQAGWFATNTGKLTLPDQYMSSTANSNWGGNPNDANPILVNSIRFTNFVNLQPDVFSGSVLAKDNPGMPAGLYGVVSAWDFSGLTFTNATMKVRYDEQSLTVPQQSALKLWHYTGGVWQNITNGGVDTTNKWINSNLITSLSPFAVALAQSPGVAYWTGDQSSLWNTDNGPGNTNWATNASGAIDTGALPDGTTDVFFTANSASNLTNTLGANFGVKSLTFTGAGTQAGTNSVNIGGAHTLTVGSGGMYVSPGSNAHTISSNMAFGLGFPGWNNDSSNLFTISGNINSGTAVAAIAGTGNSLISGNVTGGGSLVKNGVSTLTMTGAANSYTGTTTVNQGKMIVNGTHTGGGTYTVNNGGTLGGSGSISAAVVVNNGGTLSPGNSPGTFSTGSQTWNPGGNLLFEINDATGIAGNDPGWDLLSISGTLNLSALSASNEFNIDLTSLDTLNVSNPADNFNPTGTFAWLFADAVSAISTYTGANQFLVDTSAFLNPLSGTFSVLRGDNASVLALHPLANDSELYLYYAGAASAVPEPSTYALGLIGLIGMGLLVWRKRRNK